MSTSVARSFNEAVQWARSHNPFKATKIMPVYGGDAVIGIRKASFWEGLTVRFYSESRRRDLNIACALGLRALRYDDSIKIKDTRYQFANGSARFVHRTADPLASGKQVHFLIQHGLLPLGTISSQTDVEASGKKLVDRQEIGRKWAHSPVAPFSFRTAIQMASPETGRRSDLVFKVNPAVDVSKVKQFSFIPSNSRHVVPTSFPAAWTHTAAIFDDAGVLTDTINTKWVFKENVGSDKAIYISEDGIAAREFALKEIFAQPDNLIHEAPDGALSLWRLRHDPLNNQVRWMVSHYDSHGRAIQPVDQPEADSLIRALASQKSPWRPCPNPFVFVGNTDPLSTSEKRVQFDGEVEVHQGPGATALDNLKAPITTDSVLSRKAYDDVYNKSLKYTHQHLVNQVDGLHAELNNTPKTDPSYQEKKDHVKWVESAIREIVEVQTNRHNEKVDLEKGLPYPGLAKNRPPVRVSPEVEELMHRLRDAEITREKLSSNFTPDPKLGVSVREQTLREYGGRGETPVTFQRLQALDQAIIETRNNRVATGLIGVPLTIAAAKDLARDLSNLARTIEPPTAEQLKQRSVTIANFENVIQQLQDRIVVLDTLKDIYDSEAATASVTPELRSLTHRALVDEYQQDLRQTIAHYTSGLSALKETFAEDISPIFPNTHHVPQETSYSLVGPSEPEETDVYVEPAKPAKPRHSLIEPSLYDLVDDSFESSADIARRRPLPPTPEEDDVYVEPENQYVGPALSLGTDDEDGYATIRTVEVEVYPTSEDEAPEVLPAPIAHPAPVHHASSESFAVIEDAPAAQTAVVSIPRSPLVPAALDNIIEPSVNHVLPIPFPEPLAGVTPEELENFVRDQIVSEEFAVEPDYDLPTDAKALLAQRSAQTVINQLLETRPLPPVPSIVAPRIPAPISSYALPAEAVAAIEALDQQLGQEGLPPPRGDLSPIRLDETGREEFFFTAPLSPSGRTTTEDILQDIDNFQTNAQALLAQFDQFIARPVNDVPPLNQGNPPSLTGPGEETSPFPFSNTDDLN